jgi:hypothetical protein
MVVLIINSPWPPGTGDAGPRPFEEFALSFGGAAEAVGEKLADTLLWIVPQIRGCELAATRKDDFKV